MAAEIVPVRGWGRRFLKKTFNTEGTENPGRNANAADSAALFALG
jgi:hypothetical protein